MDAVAEQDIELQRNAASYIGELETKLPRFLFHTVANGQVRARWSVRAVTTVRLCNLLEPFQEWPQLLDPHLPALVRPLQDALLNSCKLAGSKRSRQRSNELVQPLDLAVCKLLYTLCKVRGAKVISRFLDSSTGNLELVLAALERKLDHSWEQTESLPQSSATWEEKYVYMLWISHLLFAPFDLNTVGSAEVKPSFVNANIQLNERLPAIAARLVHVAMRHLGSASKERDAAVKLLSRLAARPDMLWLGVHDSLFEYALSTLKNLQSDFEQVKPYSLIGCLSLLAGLLSTIKVAALKPYILIVFKSLLSIAGESSSSVNLTISTAVSRKLVVKNLCLLCTLSLQLADDPYQQDATSFSEYILEESIDHLLTSLADKDTPVRQAASKAISVIVLKLDANLAAEVVEAVIGSLDENVIWLDEADPQIVRRQNVQSSSRQRGGRRDLSAVNSLRWHGLVLTLAQLLFQRSAPNTQLAAILNSLILALGFEQRATSGSSIGGNVRDAANFGLWSIARKYSTDELLRVDLGSVRALTTESDFGTVTILQALAGELVVAATLDPSGNIRRGSSAALQELIGRHPDTIFEGIPVVQVVDYHAISLRSNAFSTVATKAARLHGFYWETLLVAMMGWRGLEAADASSRRLAATSISFLAREKGSKGIMKATQLIYERLVKGKIRGVERRHGLLLASSALLSTMVPDTDSVALIMHFWALLKPSRIYTQDDLISQTRKPELSAEGVSELIASIAGTSAGQQSIRNAVEPDILENCMASLTLAMDRREDPVLLAAARGAKYMFPLLEDCRRGAYIEQWINKVDTRLTSHDTGPNQGYLSGLASVYNEMDPIGGNEIRKSILSCLFRAITSGPVDDVHTRVASLAALRQGIFQESGDVTEETVKILAHSLQDYTIDKRGDIGSLVRLEAVEVVHHLLKQCHFSMAQDKERLLAQVAVLAGEKLDKLRYYAWICLRDNWELLDAGSPPPNTPSTITQTSTQAFFSALLALLRVPWLQRAILQGICISTGAGSESTLRAARAALVEHLLGSTEASLSTIYTIMLELLRDNLTEDRICVPMLDTWAYLFQSDILSGGSGDEFSYRRLFVLVQKAHFKSGNIQKLTAAVHVYAVLAEQSELREDVLKKLATMLLHPLPKIRNAAADALYMGSHNDRLLGTDWSKAPKDLKATADKVKSDVITNVTNNSGQ